MIRFHFRLLLIDEIAPWGGDKPSLHWFGLTMGWFWMTVGDQELFRYTDEARAFWAGSGDGTGHGLPYEDYPIARYFEDLLEMLPEILDAVPDDITARVRDADTWEAWRSKAQEWQERTDTDEGGETWFSAVCWWGRRLWNAGHLSHPPEIALWRVGETVTVRWDNRKVTVGDGIPVWTATTGEITVPVADFIAAITDFADRFLGAMAERVETTQTYWSRPEITLDSQELTQSQQTHAEMPGAALNPWGWDVRRGISWDDVRTAIARIDNIGDPPDF